MSQLVLTRQVEHFCLFFLSFSVVFFFSFLNVLSYIYILIFDLFGCFCVWFLWVFFIFLRDVAPW